MLSTHLVMVWETIALFRLADKLRANLENTLKAYTIDYIAIRLAQQSVVDEVHRQVDKMVESTHERGL